MADEIGRAFLNADYGNVANILAGIFLILVLILSIFLIVAVVFLILDVIGKWKIFKKAGEPGWKALIPIYSTYTRCVITGISPWWLVVILICYLLGSFIWPFNFLAKIVVVYFSIIISLSTARSFGKSDGFGIGLFLLSPIFSMILGFDNSKYEGKNSIGDLLGSIESDNNDVSKKKEKTTKTKKTSTKKKPVKKNTSSKKSTTTKKVTKQNTKKAQPKKKTTTKKNAKNKSS